MDPRLDARRHTSGDLPDMGSLASDVTGLLDDYVAHARRREDDSLPLTALRTRSLAAREVLARAIGVQDLADVTAYVRGRVPWPAGREPDPRDVVSLAQVIALQNVRPTDPADGLALLDCALERFGPDRIPPARQALHAQLALCLGVRERAVELCATYRRIPDLPRRILLTDLANPFTGPAGDGWLERFQEFFPAPYPVLTTGDDRTPFDRLTAGVPGTAGGELVTIIVTSYLPDARLLTTVRSLLGQSWQDLEILIVDDGSPPEHHAVLDRCLELDGRVRLLRMEVNGGTYRARNVGLDAASGDYVTFEDSDDWCHPARIQHQLMPLLEEPRLVATVCNELSTTDQLSITKPGRESLMPRATSLMLRRKAVLERMGYFDGVRKAADTEFRQRVDAAFGPGAVRQLAGPAYTVHRRHGDSLSAGDFGAGWAHPARTAYWSAYRHWHRQIRAGPASPYLPRERERSRLGVTAPLERRDGHRPPRAYDVVYVTDWQVCGEPQRAALYEIQALVRHGLRVGVVHLETYRQMSRHRRHLCGAVQELINAGAVDHVLFSDHAEVALLLVRQPSVLQFPPASASGLRAGTAVVIADEAPSARDGSDRRYAPDMCASVVAEMFSADALWCPQDPGVRELLLRHVPAADMISTDMPVVVDVNRYRAPRSRRRSTRPVLGREFGPNWIEWADPLVSAVYPDRDDLDIRLLGESVTLRGALAGEVPASWLVYEPGETDLRCFLHQIDFYVDFPSALRAESRVRSVVEALAAGCVVVLPERFRNVFGDAAVYSAAGDVPEVLWRYHTDVDLLLDQSRRATARAQDFVTAEPFLRLVAPWIRKGGTLTGRGQVSQGG